MAKKNGFRHRKTAPIPGKVNPQGQKTFLDQQLTPVLEQAEAKERHVFFMDAAHFVMGAFIGYLWSVVRIFTPTSPGRRRFNVLGALHAITHELVTVVNDTYINTESIIMLLKRLAEKFTDLPITVVLDNASYQRNQRVMETAKELHIELLFLPPYSPNLNLIERFWKFVRSECLNAKYYKTFNAFRDAIETCLVDTQGKHKARLNKLLTLKFQLFDEAA